MNYMYVSDHAFKFENVVIVSMLLELLPLCLWLCVCVCVCACACACVHVCGKGGGGECLLVCSVQCAREELPFPSSLLFFSAAW